MELLNERIERADSFIATGIETNNQPTKLWQKSNISHKYGKTIKDSDHFSHTDKECVLGNLKDGKNPTSKLTAENLEYIYADIRERKKQGKLKSYNLFLVTSTFHVLKTAIEIEKHFYNAIEDKPDNIVFIGNEKFFDLAHNKVNCKSKEKGTFHKKKLKSFLYELFLHTLDKNAVAR